MQVPRQAQGTGQLCTWIVEADAGQWHVWVITTWIAPHLGSVAYSPYTSRARASRVTEVLNGGKAIKKKAEPCGRKPDRPVFTPVDCISLYRHPFLMVSLSLDPVCPCHLWILTALLVDSLWKAETYFPYVIAVSWNWWLFSCFRLMSLSLGILIFWHLFFLGPYHFSSLSLRI